MTQHSHYPIESKILDLIEEAYTLRVNNLKHSIFITLEALELSKQSCNQSLIAKSFSRLAFYYMIE
jgi:hypothetical protein